GVERLATRRELSEVRGADPARPARAHQRAELDGRAARCGDLPLREYELGPSRAELCRGHLRDPVAQLDRGLQHGVARHVELPRREGATGRRRELRITDVHRDTRDVDTEYL